MVLRVPVTCEVDVRVALLHGGIGADLLNHGEDCFAVSHCKGATSAEIVLDVNHY